MNPFETHLAAQAYITASRDRARRGEANQRRAARRTREERRRTRRVRIMFWLFVLLWAALILALLDGPEAKSDEPAVAVPVVQVIPGSCATP